MENSALEWCSDHRMHHKMTDSDEDPYSASRGFWYSHIGWILIEEEKLNQLEESSSELNTTLSETSDEMQKNDLIMELVFPIR